MNLAVAVKISVSSLLSRKINLEILDRLEKFGYFCATRLNKIFLLIENFEQMHRKCNSSSMSPEEQLVQILCDLGI